MFGLRMPELLIILVVVLLIFGTKKLPQLGDTLGKGIRAFRKASEKGFGDDKEEAAKAQQPGPAQASGARVTPPPGKVGKS